MDEIKLPIKSMESTFNVSLEGIELSHLADALRYSDVLREYQRQFGGRLFAIDGTYKGPKKVYVSPSLRQVSTVEAIDMALSSASDYDY